MMKDNKIEKNKTISDKSLRKKFSGIVISDKMDKTIVVKVDNIKMHSKYKKRYAVSRKYKVHDAMGEFKEGDKVSFVECRPLSKDKRWRVLYGANGRNSRIS